MVSAAPVRLHGINYNSRQGPDFAWDKCKSRDQIERDLTVLKQFTNRIRILSLGDCGQGDLVLSVAKDLGMQVWLGVWISESDYVFEGEKGALFGLINRGLIDNSTVLGVTVGSESLYREEVTSEQIIGYMDQVRGILANGGLSDLTVTVADIAPIYNKYSNLRSAVDVIYANIFPFWEGIPIGGAIADMVGDLDWLMNLPESRGKELIIGETGWPESGTVEVVEGQLGVPSPENQVRFFIDFYCEIGIKRQWKYYWFTAIDNKWRQQQNIGNTIEGTFGFLDENLQLKPHFQRVAFTCANGETYSFSEMEWTVPAAPTAAPIPFVPQEERELAESCSSHPACANLDLFGNCCPTGGPNSIFLGCCDNLFVDSTPSPTRFPTMESEATLVPTQFPITSPPTVTGATPPPTRTPTPLPTTAPTPPPTRAPAPPPTRTPTTRAPTRTPTPPPQKAPTPPPTKAPTPPPTRTPPTRAPTKTPTPPPTTPPGTPSTSPATQPPTVTSLFPTTASPSNIAPVTSDPTKILSPTQSGSPTSLVPKIEVARNLQMSLLGLIGCEDYCQNAFISKQNNHTGSYYGTSNDAFKVLGNYPTIKSVDPIYADGGRRRLQEDQVGVQMTYDHTFEYVAPNAEISAEQLAGLPFASEQSRNNFLQSLQEYVIFSNVTEVSSITFPDVTPEPSSAPSLKPTRGLTRPPSSTSQINDQAAPQKGDVYSIGVIVGIAVGGSILILVCLFCFCVAKRRSQEDSPSQEGEYLPPGDDLSFPFSTVYTKE